MADVKCKKGFTLIELLVVIAVIAVLLAILMPMLKKAKEKTRELICRTNLRQFATLGLTYAHDNNGQFVECHAPTGIGSFAVFTTNSSHTNNVWWGAGHFYERGVLENAKTYYCPGNTNKTHQFGKDHPDPSNNGGGWPNGELPEDLHPGQIWVQITYHYRSLYPNYPDNWDKPRSVNAGKDPGGTAFMSDAFADPGRGVDSHHKDRYNVAYIDGHCEAVVDKAEDIKNYNGGILYHANHQKQEEVWRKFFDIN